tara:strand:+ start:1407 stop:1889 length:483 start_codon:yes stop_codon:yes gene_type:complete
MSTLKVDTIQGKTSAGTVAMPAGHVIQVIENSTTTQVNSTSTTYADTGLTATITPQFTSSKIAIFISQNVHKSYQHTDQIQLNILRGSTQLVQWATELLHDDGALNHFNIYGSQSYIDSPSTTSPTTYKTQFRRRLSTSAQVSVQYASGRSSIMLMEISG